MKPGSIYISLLLFISAYTGIAQPGNNKPLFQHHPSGFTFDSVIYLANLYILNIANRIFLIKSGKRQNKSKRSGYIGLRSNPPDLRKVVNNLVSQLTITLADMKSANGITVVSAYLLKFDSTNVRTLEPVRGCFTCRFPF